MSRPSKRAQALACRMSGMRWAQIAKEVGFGSALVAKQAVGATSPSLSRCDAPEPSVCELQRALTFAKLGYSDEYVDAIVDSEDPDRLATFIRRAGLSKADFAAFQAETRTVVENTSLAEAARRIGFGVTPAQVCHALKKHAQREGLPWPIKNRKRAELKKPRLESLRDGRRAYWLRAETGAIWPAIAKSLGIPRSTAVNHAKAYSLATGRPWLPPPTTGVDGRSTAVGSLRDREDAKALHANNFRYGDIGVILGVREETVRSFVRKRCAKGAPPEKATPVPAKAAERRNPPLLLEALEGARTRLEELKHLDLIADVQRGARHVELAQGRLHIDGREVPELAICVNAAITDFVAKEAARLGVVVEADGAAC